MSDNKYCDNLIKLLRERPDYEEGRGLLWEAALELEGRQRTCEALFKALDAAMMVERWRGDAQCGR